MELQKYKSVDEIIDKWSKEWFQYIKNNHNKNDDELFMEEFNTYNLTSKNKLIDVVDDNFILNKIKNIQKNDNEKLNEVYENKFKECLLKIN